ncbi:MAG: DNA polymerase III subunit beta, partial [Patescibacteria group bacterium]
EFPLLPTIERTTGHAVPLVELLGALQQVTLAAATSDSRPEIAGVLFNFQPTKQQLTIAATDSYRLSEKKLVLVASQQEDRRVIIPVRTLQEVQRALTAVLKEKTEESNDVTIYITDNQVLFVHQNWELISRIVEGQYPDYGSIIPTTHTTQIVVGVADLIKAAKSASLFSQVGVNDIFIRAAADQNELAVSSTNTQVGENISRLPAAITGQDNEVVLNHRYVLDGLQAIDTPEVLIEMVDNNTPVVIRPTRMDAESPQNYLYLIMPIKQ